MDAPLRTHALLFLLAVLFARRAAGGDAPPATGDRPRFGVRVAAESRAGPWRAWVEVRSDLQSRALRQWVSLHRQRDGEPSTVLGVGRPHGVPESLRVAEDGLVVVQDRPTAPTLVFAPGATAGVPRDDLPLGPASTFLPGGLLAVGGVAPAGEGPRLRVVWAPRTTSADGTPALARAVELGRVDGAAAYRAAATVTVAAHETPEAPGVLVVTWQVRVANVRHAGDATISRTSSSPTGAPVLQTATRATPLVQTIGEALDVLLRPSVGPGSRDDVLAAAAWVEREGEAGVAALADRWAALAIDDPAWDRLLADAPGLATRALPRWWASTGHGASPRPAEGRFHTPALGGPEGEPAEAVGGADAPIAGLAWSERTADDGPTLASLELLFRRPGGGPAAGPRWGRATVTPARDTAPEGFVLGALFVTAGRQVHGLRAVWFGATTDGGLDPTRVRLGPWMGRRGAGAPRRLGGVRPVVGVHVRHDGERVHAIGLVERAPPGSRVKVAAVQCPSDLGEVARNTARLAALVARAAQAGAQLVVLPEAAVTGYLSQDLRTTWQAPGRPRASAFDEGKDPTPFAEPVPGPSSRRFAALAASLGVYLTVPLVEAAPSPDGRARFFNTVVLVSPSGAVVAHYRKLSPWPHPEASWATAGDLGLATAGTPFGRVGLAVCFDVHETVPRYAALEAGRSLWALLYPIAWVSDGDDARWFGVELPRRVRDAGFHVIGANWSVDAPQPWHGAGHSLVVARDGTVVASATTATGDEVVAAELPVGP